MAITLSPGESRELSVAMTPLVVPPPTPEATATLTWDVMPPVFDPGSVHTATALIGNPTSQEWDFTVHLWVGTDRVAVERLGIVGAGQTRQLVFNNVPVPAVPGTWNVDLHILDTHTGYLAAHIRVDPITVTSEEPPPPPGELSAADIVKILEWARCSHYFTDPPNQLGVACRAIQSYPGGYYDARVAANDGIRGRAADKAWALMLTQGFPSALSFFKDAMYYPGYVTTDIFLGAGSWPPGTAAALLAWMESQGLDWDYNSKLNLPIGPFCAEELELYWSGLSEANKLSIWIRPAYFECAAALRTMNQLYASQWAPCTLAALLDYASIFGAGFNEEDAIWAAEHLDDYPWV
ncbi:hypothetical protein ES703_41918 [subsurface metagenome]